VGREHPRRHRPPQGHSDLVNALCVLPDGRLASGSFDHTIRLWDVNTGAETARLEAPEEIVVVAKGPGASLAGECPAAVSTAWVDTNCCLA
jgi:WD40 repeat protein